MNPIYDETYMGGYRTSFNTILERGVRELNTTGETSTVVFNEVKRKKRRERRGWQTTRESKMVSRWSAFPLQHTLHYIPSILFCLSFIYSCVNLINTQPKKKKQLLYK